MCDKAARFNRKNKTFGDLTSPISSGLKRREVIERAIHFNRMKELCVIAKPFRRRNFRIKRSIPVVVAPSGGSYFRFHNFFVKDF